MIADEYLNENVEKLLKEIAEAEDFRDYNIEDDNSKEGVKGDGFLGIIKSVKINSKSNNKILNLIVKCAPKSEALRSQTSIEELFLREVYMYDTVFGAFKRFEMERGLQACKFMPTFYNSLLEYKCETIIMENLITTGYNMHEKKIPMDERHVRLVLTEYGRLHALSFALKDQDRNKFEDIVRCMDDIFSRKMIKTNTTKHFVRQCILGQKALDESEDQKTLEIYKRFIDTIEDFFKDLLKSTEKHSVILHGDCWTNNMMFQYEDELDSTKPTRVCFFDFQFSRLGSPVLDLSHFIYSCSTKEVINDLDRYLKIYHKSLFDYLRKLGSNPDEIFPYSVLVEHWKKYSRFGLVLSLLMIHIMLTEKEEAVDLSDVYEEGKSVSQAFDYKIKEFEKYKERIRPIILHFVENGFI